jgi:hypothetical protein
MLEKLSALLPSHTRRSEESDKFQQFSTPLCLGFVAAFAAQLTADDIVLEPSAGTGLLAIHGEIACASLVLNELAGTRHGMLAALFPRAPVTPSALARLKTCSPPESSRGICGQTLAGSRFLTAKSSASSLPPAEKRVCR